MTSHGGKGVTLVELIVAMVLVAIVAVVTIEFLAQYLGVALQIPSMAQNAGYAQQKMESLYMDGAWTNGSDNPAGGMTRAWSVATGTYSNDYPVVAVDVR